MSNLDLIQLVKERVQSLKAYHVENIDCEIKLHANENSFPPPPEILKQFEEEFKSTELNRYPDPDCGSLKQTPLISPPSSTCCWATAPTN